MKKIAINKLALSVAISLVGISSQAFAADFNIPFINGAGLGNLYAGWAAEGADASTAFTNPAALVLIPTQQFEFGGVGVLGHTEFTGTTTPPFPPSPPQTGTAGSELRGLIPSTYYALPLLDNRIVLGFGETIPFGLGNNYGTTSLVRYAATKSQISDIDIGPSVGVKITDKLSAGVGLDIQRLSFSINNQLGFPPFVPDSLSQNNLSDWGTGWHGGLLYQFTPATRVGVDYNSQTVFHLTGTSQLSGPIIPGNGIVNSNLNANVTLPALAQVSIYHDINQQWNVMATVFYSNWSSFKQVTLNNIQVPGGTAISNTVPFNYHNTFDYAGGINYKPTCNWTLRAGAEYLASATGSQYRIIADPVGAGTILSVGAHYQQNKNIGYDLGYAHAFFIDTAYNNTSGFGSVIGKSSQQNNVIGAQLTWSIT